MWAPWTPTEWAPYVPFDPLSLTADEDDARGPANQKPRKKRDGKKGKKGVPGEEVNIGIKAGMGHGGKHAIMKRYDVPQTNDKTMTSKFQVKFGKGFEWGCRGKVGGMFIGEGHASGGRHTPGAASARLMWDKDGGAFANVYVPEGTQGRQRPEVSSVGGKYGARLFRGDFKNAFSEDKWNDVEMSVTLNDPGKSNGTLTMSVNGKTRTMDGIMWRTGNQGFNNFVLNPFHGGGCMATKDSNMAFRAPTFSTGAARASRGGAEPAAWNGNSRAHPSVG